MQIGEFLVKLGVVTDVSKVEKFSKSLAKVGAVAGLAVGTLNTAAAAAFSFLDGEIRKTEELAKTKNGLISISEEEIALAKEYQNSTKKLTGTLDLLKNKLALGVAPQMLSITERMNGFLLSNKKLITDGLQKVVKWLFEFAEGTISVFRSLGDLIDKTVGWKNALFILIGVLALVKKATIRAFIVNPITWVMVAIAGLILLVDDLMTYMRGGKSLFGDFWDPFIKGIRAVKKWWGELSGETKGYVKSIGSVTAAVAALISFVPGLGKAFKFASSMAIKAVMMLARVMITNPIIAVIMAIATAAYYIYKNWDDLPGFFKGMWDDVVRLTKTAFKAILKWFGLSSEQAEATVDSIGEAFSFIFDLITYPFKQAWKLIKSLFSIWTNDSKSITGKIGDSFKLVTDLIKQPFKLAWGFVSGLFSNWIGDSESAVDKIGNSFKSVVGLITKPFKQAWSFVSGSFASFIGEGESTVKSIGKTFDLVTDLISDPFKQAWESVKGLFNVWGDDSKSTVDKIGSSFSLVTAAIKKPFQQAFGWVRDEFGWLLDTLEDGFKKLKFWEDDDAHGGSSMGAMVGSNLAMQQAAGGSSVGGGSKVINGGDMKVDINVKDTDAAQVVKSTVERSGNKMAQANAQLAGGF